MSEHTAAETRDHFIRWPKIYDHFVNVFTFGRAVRLRQATIDVAQIRSGESVLDAGCGTGDLTLFAKEATGPRGHVDGIDGSPEMLAVAARKAQQRGLDVKFSQARMQDLSFANDRFDVVLASLSLHMLSVDAQTIALSEFKRVLRPGGRLVIVDFDAPTTTVGKLMAHLSGHGAVDPLSKNHVPAITRLGFVDIKRVALPLDAVAALRAVKR